eukprot:TRINITY_DN1311_c0_g1_i3.p1 TRINITY_DN1311_c0_g1~~TRINITY_DN1311_c0_g1_i3.p1  ORF type:complete len:251 (+),score=62.85 TRINITY_DN1311_c0_g1_i3:72-755(+)
MCIRDRYQRRVHGENNIYSKSESVINTHQQWETITTSGTQKIRGKSLCLAFRMQENLVKDVLPTLIETSNTFCTAVVEYLERGTVSPTYTPSKGFKVVKIKHGELEYILIDLAGEERERVFWRHQYPGTQGVIFVVDINDKERLPEAGNELAQILKEKELEKAMILVLLNKSDISGFDQTTTSVLTDMGVADKVEGNPRVFVNFCSLTMNRGVEEGVKWLDSNMQAL